MQKLIGFLINCVKFVNENESSRAIRLEAYNALSNTLGEKEMLHVFGPLVFEAI